VPHTKYQVHLCVDGRHSVSVQSDDPAAVTEGLLWAKQTWGQLVRLPGKAFPTLPQDGSVPIDQTAQAKAPRQDQRSDQTDDEPPICGVHQVPMVRVTGRKGSFWSCHEKLADGSWCSYRPRS
jgi:hypothetical protein